MRMKKIAAVLAFTILSLTLCGCTNGGKEYSVYTNIPRSEFKITAKNYKVAEVIPSQNKFSGGVVGDTEGFSSKWQEYIGVMNTDAFLTVSADFSDEQTQTAYTSLCKDVQDLLTAAENSLSAYTKGSCAEAFNAAGAGATVKVDKIFYDVMSVAKEMYALTDGYYNPAVYYSVRAFKFDGSRYPKSAAELPDNETLSKYVELSSCFGEVELNEISGEYYARKPQKTVEVGGETLSLKVDLGGVGKGYVCDRVDGLYDKYGFEYGYFNFGSSSMAFKKYYGRGDYTFALVEPRRTVPSYIEFNLHDVTVSSSADNENYYILDGKRYCHIIDPFTGAPVRTGIMSASVAGGSAAENDALTTAIMAMGRDKALEFIKTRLSNRYAVFTYEGA